MNQSEGNTTYTNVYSGTATMKMWTKLQMIRGFTKTSFISITGKKRPFKIF